MKKYGELEYDQYSILFLLVITAMFLSAGFYLFNERRDQEVRERVRAEKLFDTYISKRNVTLKRNSERYLNFGVVDKSEFEFMALEKNNSWKIENGWKTDFGGDEAAGLDEVLSKGMNGVIYLRGRYFLYSGVVVGEKSAVSFWEIDGNFLDVFYNLTGIKADYGRAGSDYYLKVANSNTPLGISFSILRSERKHYYIMVIYGLGLLMLLWTFNKSSKMRLKSEEEKLLEAISIIRETSGSKRILPDGEMLLKRLDEALISLGEEYYKKTREIKELRSSLTRTNLELRELVISDRLTGVYNKSFMYEVIEDMKKQRVELPYHSIIMMIDLDNFKKLNDSEGHLAGDGLLRDVGELLKEIGREGGKAFRYGGDEFFLIFNSIKYEEFLEVLNEFERRKSMLIKRYLHVKLGISAGVVVIDRSDEIDGEKLIKKVDDLLYRAKKNGKNQIVIES